MEGPKVNSYTYQSSQESSSIDNRLSGDGECEVNPGHEEKQHVGTPLQLRKNGIDQYECGEGLEITSQNSKDLNETPLKVNGSADPSVSVCGDSPSVHNSVLSSPTESMIVPSSSSQLDHENLATLPFRPFDRRFQSRLSSPSLSTLRVSSPAYFNSHSQGTSISSKTILDSTGDDDTSSTPWEVVRWTKLRKINGQAFSEVGKRNFGIPTFISISTFVVVGTSKGIILIFDYHQDIKSIIGPGTKAVEAGPLTSIAVSADHLVIAGGHANGSIFTWEISRTSSPFLHIPSLDSSQLTSRSLDGHTPNVAVRHLGFLGTRHTALVSADDRGMAFSHLASRGLGSLGRAVKSTRILGRYSNMSATLGKPRSRSAILALSPLPLGNVELGSDTMGLTAILTPHLLVIVSTIPLAQTYYKVAKPKDLDTYMPLSGCLAWFPAVRLKEVDSKTDRDISKIKLVYCWSNILMVLNVEEFQHLDSPPTFSFKVQSRWKAEEAIVAVEWLSRSVLSVLTVTQRLIILEDKSVRIIHMLDLVNKHIYHQDIFSEQLKSLVQQQNNENQSIPRVIADAYYMSFKAYKNRIFILGFNHVSIGTVSNWADRLIATMKNGDYIGAVQLATCYYTGNTENLIVGLPEDSSLRHSILQEKLIEIMRASLKYTFGQHQKKEQTESEDNLRNLAGACIEACLCMENHDFLFDEVFEWYENGKSRDIFFKTLEPQILEKRITLIPPTVVKNLVAVYLSQGLEFRLEDIICHIEPSSLDIDQITILCKQYSLIDALACVWNKALHDYITPLIEMLKLLISLTHDNCGKVEENYLLHANVRKIFPYLSFTLTGRIYPTGEDLSDQEAILAKADLYRFLFSGKTEDLSGGTENLFMAKSSQNHESTFPYLRMILQFDAPSFLSVMNEAFEDTFLNNTPEEVIEGDDTRNHTSEERHSGISFNRQYIITILLEIMNPCDFTTGFMIYLNIFIARNLPKFPQYILLSSNILHKVLIGLCQYPSQEIADDAELSTEYLLSVYRPSDMPSLLPLFHKVGFYRVLKSIYKSERQFGKLIETYFEDPNDKYSVFDCISDCLRPQSGLKKRQIQDVHLKILTHSLELLHLDAIKTAQTLDLYATELHERVLDALSDELNLKYVYLNTIFDQEMRNEEQPNLPQRFLENYLALMCRFEPKKVAKYVEKVQISRLHLDRILSYMEDNEVIDAAVVLMTRHGLFKEALNRLIKYMNKLEVEFVEILTSSTKDTQHLSENKAVKDLLDTFQKFINIGIWLCEKQCRYKSRCYISSPIQKKAQAESELLSEEIFWLDLIDISVQMAQNLSSKLNNLSESITYWKNQREFILSQLRSPVQRIFSTLLALTSSSTSSNTRLSFLRILRAFLTRAAILSPHLTDLRAVLASVFFAYTYEENILQLTNRLIEEDLFVNVQAAINSRQRGWRPCSSICEGCGQRIWGTGAVGDIYSRWEKQEARQVQRRKARNFELVSSSSERGKAPAYDRCSTFDKVKSKSHEDDYQSDERLVIRNVNLAATLNESGQREEQRTDIGIVRSEDRKRQEYHQANGKLKAENQKMDLGPLVVLACRHAYHQSCLEKILRQENNSATANLLSEGAEFTCPIHR